MEKISTFDRRFPDEDACKAYLSANRWPGGVRCRRCNRLEKVYPLNKPFHWRCRNADCGGRDGYKFSVITHTIFQDTKIPMRLWFKVAFLILTSKKGISALQIHRVIFGEDSGSDYRTSWFMCMRWRAAMRGNLTYTPPLTGEVEVDETYVGGKNKNRHFYKKQDGRGPAGKVAVIGAIARKGMVVAKVIENTSKETLDRFVRQTVSPRVSLVATDDAPQYEDLRPEYPHDSVNHSAHEYVRGLVHTSGIDSFWSLLKRGIMGSFHHVSKEYLPMYVNEFSWRRNQRKNPDAFNDLVTTCGK